jgi:hypothetical protein
MQLMRWYFVSECTDAQQAKRRAYRHALTLFLGWVVLACFAMSKPLLAYASSEMLTGITAPQAVDPNKGPSELNHHVAGFALIGVGLLALASLFSPRSQSHGYLWPTLFVLVGLYLALWSDGEIWPRGNLNWSWLFEHDAEARQHKIYSFLLIAIGIIEYARLRGSLPRLWKTWAFPVLALIGAGMLLIHDHNGGSGARSPEAQAYLVNQALDVDGSPRKSSSLAILANTTQDQRLVHFSSENVMSDSALDSNSTPMNHLQMEMDAARASNIAILHHHAMTASMLHVEREHMWFMIVGLAIGLFKFISDGEFFRTRVVSYLWPSCVVLLGFMLVFYRE